jgi:hypothetical protein
MLKDNHALTIAFFAPSFILILDRINNYNSALPLAK